MRSVSELIKRASSRQKYLDADSKKRADTMAKRKTRLFTRSIEKNNV